MVGFIGLDPFDCTMPGEAERLGLAAAGKLRTEALLLRAPPSRCNGEAVAAPWGTVLPALWRDELIAGASHCDFESPTDWMCRLACGDTDPARQQRVRQGVPDAAARRTAGSFRQPPTFIHQTRAAADSLEPKFKCHQPVRSVSGRTPVDARL